MFAHLKLFGRGDLLGVSAVGMPDYGRTDKTTEIMIKTAVGVGTAKLWADALSRACRGRKKRMKHGA
jgi:hypothetical protein